MLIRVYRLVLVINLYFGLGTEYFLTRNVSASKSVTIKRLKSDKKLTLSGQKGKNRLC